MKEYLVSLIKHRFYLLAAYQKLVDIKIKYTFECGCKMRPTNMFMEINECPMSSSICICCPHCNLLNEAKIIEPETFYCQLMPKEFKLDELKDMEFSDTWQKPFMEYYKQKSIENSLKKGNLNEY